MKSTVHDRSTSNSPDWIEIYKYIRTLFLNGNESNINNLIEDIRSILQAFPKESTDESYVGNLNGNYDFLKNFEVLPEQPADKNFILKTVSKIFSGALKWHHPHVMHNINPTPMISSVATACVVNLYNPNVLWDFVSAGSHEMEQQIIRQMAALVGWDNHVDGAFTFGGKGCLTYAIRIGLNRCVSNISSKGLSYLKKQPVVITSKANHYSIDTVCSLVGIGYENCLRADVNIDDTMDISSFERILDKALSEGHPIAAIIVSGGNTLHLSIDNLLEIHQIVTLYTNKYRLTYCPYIYFDTVVGWPWLFFKEYPFDKNPLKLTNKTKLTIEKAAKKIKAIHLADGYGIDFHKTGFCPYLTSLFITKVGSELHSIHKDHIAPFERKPFGGNFLQHHTVEHSRSAAPIMSAWVVLQTAGIKGFQSYIANHITIAFEIRKLLPRYGFDLLNSYSLGFASVFCPISAKEKYNYANLLEEKEDIINKYNQYTYRLFLYLQDKQQNGHSSFILRFLPQYQQAACGKNVAVLVVYPMAMDINVREAQNISHTIGRIKEEFDLIKEHQEDISNLIPAHVPK